MSYELRCTGTRWVVYGPDGSQEEFPYSKEGHGRAKARIAELMSVRKYGEQAKKAQRITSERLLTQPSTKTQ
jgi:hypothetical protein